MRLADSLIYKIIVDKKENCFDELLFLSSRLAGEKNLSFPVLFSSFVTFVCIVIKLNFSRFLMMSSDENV